MWSQSNGNLICYCLKKRTKFDKGLNFIGHKFKILKYTYLQQQFHLFLVLWSSQLIWLAQQKIRNWYYLLFRLMRLERLKTIYSNRSSEQFLKYVCIWIFLDFDNLNKYRISLNSVLSRTFKYLSSLDGETI